jgi:hypothetical protein
MTTPPVPFPRSYWVIPGKLLAGFYPGSKDPQEANDKLTALINAGIRHVINLMEPDERDLTGHRFVPYDEVMESHSGEDADLGNLRPAAGQGSVHTHLSLYDKNPEPDRPLHQK